MPRFCASRATLMCAIPRRGPDEADDRPSLSVDPDLAGVHEPAAEQRAMLLGDPRQVGHLVPSPDEDAADHRRVARRRASDHRRNLGRMARKRRRAGPPDAHLHAHGRQRRDEPRRRLACVQARPADRRLRSGGRAQLAARRRARRRRPDAARRRARTRPERTLRRRRRPVGPVRGRRTAPRRAGARRRAWRPTATRSTPTSRR